MSYGGNNSKSPEVSNRCLNRLVNDQEIVISQSSSPSDYNSSIDAYNAPSHQPKLINASQGSLNKMMAVTKERELKRVRTRETARPKSKLESQRTFLS